MTHCYIRGCRKAAPKLLPCLLFFALKDKYGQKKKKALKRTCFFWLVSTIVQSPGGAEALNGVESGGSTGLKLDSVKG